jgi:hypothetical protein
MLISMRSGRRMRQGVVHVTARTNLHTGGVRLDGSIVDLSHLCHTTARLEVQRRCSRKTRKYPLDYRWRARRATKRRATGYIVLFFVLPSDTLDYGTRLPALFG